MAKSDADIIQNVADMLGHNIQNSGSDFDRLNVNTLVVPDERQITLGNGDKVPARREIVEVAKMYILHLQKSGDFGGTHDENAQAVVDATQSFFQDAKSKDDFYKKKAKLAFENGVLSADLPMDEKTRDKINDKSEAVGNAIFNDAPLVRNLGLTQASKGALASVKQAVSKTHDAELSKLLDTLTKAPAVADETGKSLNHALEVSKTVLRQSEKTALLAVLKNPDNKEIADGMKNSKDEKSAKDALLKAAEQIKDKDIKEHVEKAIEMKKTTLVTPAGKDPLAMGVKTTLAQYSSKLSI